MGNSGKIRVVVFTLILIILAYFSIGYTGEVYYTGLKSVVVDVDDINYISVDGADVTPLCRFLGLGLNSMLAMFAYFVYTLIILLTSIFLLVPLRLIGIKESTIISETEQKISKRIFIGMIFLSLIVGMVLTRGTFILPLCIYTLIWSVMTWLIYIQRVCSVVDEENM